MNQNWGLSDRTRKALSVHIGEAAANELTNLLQRMGQQIEELKHTKVSVTQVVPGAKRDPNAALDNETF